MTVSVTTFELSRRNRCCGLENIKGYQAFEPLSSRTVLIPTLRCSKTGSIRFRAGVGRCQPITVDFGIPLCRASNRFNRHDQRRHKRRQGAVTLDDVSHLPITKLLYQWHRRDSDIGVTIRHVGPQFLPES